MTGFSALSHNDVEEDDRQWQGSAKVSGPKFLKMPLLTVGMFGLQIIWSVEMSYGVLSDHSHSRFGRRRPYILSGVIVAFFAMYLLGFTRNFANVFTHSGSAWNNNLTIALAVFSIYLIDFSINAVQAMDRALLIDLLPASEQEEANAWAGRIGNVDLTVTLPSFGSNQLEILCVVTSTLLLTAHCITLFNVSERALLPSTDMNSPVPSTEVERQMLEAEATRLGSRALFYNALIAEAIHTTDSSETSHFLIGDEDGSSDVDDVIPLRDTRTHRGSSEQTFGNRSEVRNDSLEIKPEDAENELSLSGKRVRFADEISELGSPHPRLSKEIDEVSSATTSLLGMNAIAQRSRESLEYPHDEDRPGGKGSTRDRTIEDNAGIILGIHNVFVVIPQFIITGLSSIIFAIMDPEKSALDSHNRPAHPGGLPSIPIGNNTVGDNNLAANVLMPRAGGEDSTRNADSVGIIFR
ncbi:hypothetical protein Clacol_008860 [Clathrus columnatus]|uniref:Uncharacterized protein n=1 Tax=Clathrus columnatus TaxID=1419009 RepID=A0AAV5AIY3_9AGAM|nr:hypothetical protein Clacol_008860 [Clathrus columnatus]